MADNEVVYTFRAVDEVSGPMAKAKAQLEATASAMAQAETSAGKATQATVEATVSGSSAAPVLDTAGASAEQTAKKAKTAEAQLNQTAQAAATATASQQTAILKSVETLTALQGIQSGLSAVTSAVNTLGLVDEETFKTLQKVTAGVQLVVGTAQAVKGVVTIFQTLNSVLKTTAIVSTFASIAENPAKGAAIIAGASLAAGAVGGYMMSSINNSKTTTINVAHESTARTAQTVVDAGAWY